MVGENSRKVIIYLIDDNSNSKLLIRPYSPNSNYSLDSNIEELVY